MNKRVVRTRCRWELILPLLAMSAMCASPTVLMAEGSVSPGEKLYKDKKCGACHGSLGQGGAAGPRLAPDPIGADAFLAQLRNPMRDMPPYTPALLTGRQIDQIYQYLRAIKPGPPASRIPELSK
jgi:mono/diheme cytochrome c family protein